MPEKTARRAGARSGPQPATQPKRRTGDRPAKRQRSASEGQGKDDAREAIVRAAANLFAERGFETTKMRDIADLAGLTVAAPYWHFESKEELYCAVYTAGIRALQDAVLREMEGIQDPWQRLKAAAVAHCRCLVFLKDVASILIPASLPASFGVRKQALQAQRDQYEDIIRALVDRIDMPAGVDRKIFTMQFLISLNGIATWFRADGDYTVEEVVEQIFRMLGHPQQVRAVARAS